MIRTAAYGAEDGAEFLRLYRASMEHYDCPRPEPAVEAQLLDLLARERHMSCVMAFDEGGAVGFATWGLVFPAGLGAALYLKELYVDAAARGSGAGRALLAHLVRIAEAEGCTRFDWQTDGPNLEAQRFYATLGAPVLDKVTYRVPRDGFAGFLTRLGA